jgi:putative oxidoreductase
VFLSVLRPWPMLVAQIFLGGIMLSGGIMHFTNDPVTTYQSEFLTSLFQTHYLWQMIGIIEIIGGAAVLTRQFLPLALVILAPITTIIFTFHLSEIGKPVLHPGGIYIAIPVVIAHLILAWYCRAHYRAMFAQRIAV